MKLELNEQAVKYILDVLATRPYMEVTGLISEIDKQIKEQKKLKLTND